MNQDSDPPGLDKSTSDAVVGAARRRTADEIERLASIVAGTDDAIIAKTTEGMIVDWNRGAEQLYGYSADEAIGRPVAMLFPRDIAAKEMQLTEGAVRGEHVEHYETRRLCKDGSVVEVSLTLSPFRDAQGTIVGISSIARDLTARKRAEAVVHRAQLLDLAHDAIIVRDPAESRVTYWNREAEEIYGYSAEEARGKITHELLETTGTEQIEAIDAALEESGRWHGELRHTRKDGGHIVVSSRQALQRDEHGEPVAIIELNSDVTERKRFEDQLVHLADHDPLTGLPNRRRLDTDLQSHADYVARYGVQGALLVLDLDHFKYVNDSLGHNAGDELIAKVGTLLRDRLRTTDTLARLGGDEFAVLLPRAGADEAQKVADDLLATVREHAVIWADEKVHRSTTSIGIALFGVDGATGEEVLASADLAMYDAKEEGRDRVAVFSSDTHREARTKSKMTWADRIRTALAEDHFVLHAQPIHDARTGEVSRYELLLRLTGRNGELIPPNTFLYIAEQVGLVEEIDRWVVSRALDALAANGDRGEQPTLEVNLSGRSIGNPALLELVETGIEQRGVDPSRLVFEVTETAAVANLQEARSFAVRLGRLGCRFALDDFGAGFGSFYYLKHLPFDFLKIDGEFISSCLTSRTDQLVIEAVVGIAQGLGKQTVAEFVEDGETADFVRDRGVDYLQGYWIGKPGPAAALLAAS
jgi:diguanylate cyclase (GGDEF)-like protein/PAS domain S-box-containing protein